MLKINLSYCSVQLSQGFHFNTLMVCLVSKEYISRNVGDYGRKLGKSVPSRKRAVWNRQSLPERENSLREFLLGRNIFVHLPTGYGKSLIFQCLPSASSALFERPYVVPVLSWWYHRRDRLWKTQWPWSSSRLSSISERRDYWPEVLLIVWRPMILRLFSSHFQFFFSFATQFIHTVGMFLFSIDRNDVFRRLHRIVSIFSRALLVRESFL